MTAVIYARYSSDSQREASIEGQLRDCKDYAEKNGITVVGTYIDRAYSAKTDDRPEFQHMIKDSAKKIFDVVLVWKLDRFARNRFDAVNYKYQLEKNGVHLVSAMEPISQGPEGIMVESMLIGMAEYYSAELALKVARGERENALQCKYNGGVVPLGFTIGKEDRLYHIDPETAPIVQEIFTRYADGEPAEKIAASLNERGLRTRTGKPFVKNSFFQIFRNRRYIGEYRYKDIVTPGGIPAIVDQDLFDRVQQRFEQNRIAHGRPAKEDVSYLLTTKLFCGKCGTLMGGESGTSHMGNTYYYYKCGNAKRHGKAHCDLKAIRKEPLERFVVETAIKVIFSDEIIERLIDLVMEAQQQENTRLPVLKEQLRDTEKRLANLLEAIEQGILTPTTKQRLDELEARKEALNTSILEEELKKPVLTREWMRFWFEKFRKGDMRDMEHQRQIIDTFVNSVYVFDDRVVLNFNFTDDAKTVTREEVLGSSAVDNAPQSGMLHRKGEGDILHVLFHVRVSLALAEHHAAVVLGRLAHLSRLLLPVKHHRDGARAADPAIKGDSSAGKVRGKLLLHKGIFQMQLRLREQLHGAEQTAHTPEILIFQPASGGKAVHLHGQGIFAEMDGGGHIEFRGGKGVLGIADVNVIAPDGGGAVRAVQPQVAACPVFRQGKAVLILPDGIIVLRNLTGVQLFVAVPRVLGIDVMGRAIGMAGLLQALHLDKTRHGQGIPVRKGRSQVFRIAESPFAVQADGQEQFRACLVRKMGVEGQAILLENFRVGQKGRGNGMIQRHKCHLAAFSAFIITQDIITPRENAGFAERPHRGHNTSRA